MYINDDVNESVKDEVILVIEYTPFRKIKKEQQKQHNI